MTWLLAIVVAECVCGFAALELRARREAAASRALQASRA